MNLKANLKMKRNIFPFNIPPYTGKEIKYIKKAVDNKKISGNGEFAKKCISFIENRFGVDKAILTTSCTHALEIAAILAGIKPGDEVIMPSYTFTSTANAFVLRGAKIVFVDIRKDTLNINENLIEAAITKRTKVIVPVHYAGVGCEMDTINAIAKKYKLLVIEDAAQGVMAKYKDKYLGAIGDIGCYSFHETKNYSGGEGGALLLNNKKFINRAEIICEKGTNRNKFLRGEIDKYTWVDIGSSYMLSEINAAYLWAQLEKADKINADRLKNWHRYYKNLKCLAEQGLLELPFIPKHCVHNGHIFYIKTNGLKQRSKLIEFLRKNNVMAIFHYVPLHSSPAGKKFGIFYGKDEVTTAESERIVRLPMFFGLKTNDIDKISDLIKKYFKKEV